MDDGKQVDYGRLLLGKVPPTLKILVVDDAATLRATMTQMLHGIGFSSVAQSPSAENALERLGRERFDVVICDWHMPGLSGFDLLNHLRKTEEHKDVPFLMVTAEGRREQVLEAVRAGVSNYIVKPFEQHQLEKKLYEIFNKRAKS